MKKFAIFILYLIVSIIQLTSGFRHLKSSEENHHSELKVHSYVKVPHNHNFIRKRSLNTSSDNIPQATNTPVKTVMPSDPCAPYDPPVPDFRAPGRRISDVKCFEYIWQLKLRDDVLNRRGACNEISSFPILGVVGGHSASDGEYPHMGAIGWKAVVGPWKFLCGGSLISSKYILTAAHCAKASDRDTTLADPVPKIVRFGVANLLDIFNIDKNITKIIVHPNYKAPMQYYDIALMELNEEVMFSEYVQPACLWTKGNNFSQGAEAEVTGWGITQSGGQETSTKLLAANVNIIDSAKCDSLLKNWHSRKWNGLKDNQICAGKLEGGVDTCQGDSGGPLSDQIPLPIKTQGNMHYVIGVTSFGIGCALKGLPGVYTRVSSFVDWIEKIVWT